MLVCVRLHFISKIQWKLLLVSVGCWVTPDLTVVTGMFSLWIFVFDCVCVWCICLEMEQWHWSFFFFDMSLCCVGLGVIFVVWCPLFLLFVWWSFNVLCDELYVLYLCCCIAGICVIFVCVLFYDKSYILFICDCQYWWYVCMCVGSDICSWEMSISLGCVSDVRRVCVRVFVSIYVNVCVCALYVFQVCVFCVDIQYMFCACMCVYMCECVQELATEQPDMNNYFYFTLFTLIYFILFYIIFL